jgi:hypothetical protein
VSAAISAAVLLTVRLIYSFLNRWTQLHFKKERFSQTRLFSFNFRWDLTWESILLSHHAQVTFDQLIT